MVFPSSFITLLGARPKGEGATSPFPGLGLLLLWSQSPGPLADECSITQRLPTDYLLSILLFLLHTLFANFINYWLNQHKQLYLNTKTYFKMTRLYFVMGNSLSEQESFVDLTNLFFQCIGVCTHCWSLKLHGAHFWGLHLKQSMN